MVENLNVADTFMLRFKGLIGKRNMLQGEGILIKPCKSIHSWFMKFSFDAVFINNNCKVVYLISDMQPFHFSPVIRNAKAVIELASGSIERFNIRIGDHLTIERRKE